ncbi:ras GTPase-activating protein raskol [Drosophila madeirensis]|uniref:Ras GTPase-activating protein raskol n=1 Tax=Drosophila madeirensis TaxID=30013 RepID=A0AAU9G4G7_DROMD
MNCGALRTVNDGGGGGGGGVVHMQQQTTKINSMPRNTGPLQQLQLQLQQQQHQTQSQSQCHRAVAIEQQPPAAAGALRRSTIPRGRGLASCLRGERDDAPTPPIHEVHCDLQQLQMLQQQEQHQHQQHQLQQLQDRCSVPANTTASGTLEPATGRSEYKSKTLPRIHFDTALNDTSLNEGNNRIDSIP